MEISFVAALLLMVNFVGAHAAGQDMKTELLAAEPCQTQFAILAEKTYSDGLYYKRDAVPYTTSKMLTPIPYTYPAPAELNALFGLDSNSALKFVAGPDGHNTGYEVTTGFYARALARGEVIITARHDIEAHVAGYARLASSPQWPQLKELLKRSFEIIDRPTATEAEKKQAWRNVRLLADALEIWTDRISRSDRIATGQIKELHQHIKDSGLDQKSYLETAAGTKELESIRSSLKWREDNVSALDDVIETVSRDFNQTRP